MNSISSIRTIIESGSFIIPVYQRDFAWSSHELERLVDDIKSAMESGRKEYYLGTLVAFRRADGRIEVVDGQQRLTALSLILAVARPELRIDLHYEARESSDKAMEMLRSSGICPSDSIFSRPSELLRGILAGRSDAFFSYLLDSVFLLFIELSPDEDLNRYFQQMNSRARQTSVTDVILSEILARMEDGRDRELCRLIWDGVRHMDRFLQESVPERIWNRMLYGDGWAPLLDSDPLSWWKMAASHVEGDGDSVLTDIDGALAIDGEEYIRPKLKEEKPSGYMGIISYHEFLLVSLSLFRGVDYGCDDREILSDFSSFISNSSYDTLRSYMCFLLKLRYLFDTYIVKVKDSGFMLCRYIDTNQFVPVFRTLGSEIIKDEMILLGRDQRIFVSSILSHLASSPEEDEEAFLSYLESRL